MNAFVKSLVDRVNGAGGNAGDFNFAADILDMAAHEADGWTGRFDDATRIPDVLGEAARALRLKAASRKTRTVGGPLKFTEYVGNNPADDHENKG